jgi:hypothetical protein
MTLHEALQQYEDNAASHAKYKEAKAYLRDAALGDPSHEVKANGKTIRLVDESYVGYEIPQKIKDQYKISKIRLLFEIS